MAEIMDRHPLNLEQFMGALSFAIGLSALQPNDSTFYTLAFSSGLPLLWIASYCLFGLLLFLSTFRPIPRCRIVLLCGLLVLWFSGLALLLFSGAALGAYGWTSIVFCIFIVWVLWVKITDDGKENSSS